MYSLGIPLSDNWWIENEKAWFCEGEIGALFCVDLNSKLCKFISQIPESHILYQTSHTYCIKYRDTIFCLPNLGENIWTYDVKSDTWEKIELTNRYQVLFCALTYKQNQSLLWFLNSGGNIFEIDLEKRMAKNIYHIGLYRNEINGEYVLVENLLYCVSDKCIYCINTDNDNITIYNLSDIKAGLLTICYDGINFWLSGLCSEIYIWNPKRGIIKTITDFHKQFGIYNFDGKKSSLVEYDLSSVSMDELLLFTTSIPLGEYIWYIPWQANQIVYINKKSYEVFTLEVEEEIETVESVKRDISAKYAVEYIREDRYIGLYSYKNRKVFEIDTIDLCVDYEEYHLSNDSILRITREVVEYNDQKVLEEHKEMQRILITALLEDGKKGAKCKSQNIGRLIYQSMDK